MTETANAIIKFNKTRDGLTWVLTGYGHLHVYTGTCLYVIIFNAVSNN